MGSRLLLQVLATRRHRGERGVISAAAGIVAALVLILSAAAVVQLSGGNLRGVFASSETRQARGAAAEGTDLMIDTWNQPQNRRLLVSGQSPTAWTAANLRSPCFNTEDGSRPGPSNDGLPDQAAINLGDGQWRDVVTGAAGGAGPNRREFRLVRITYSASDGRTTPDPRALRRTATPGGAITGSALPTGFATWDQLVNLNDPDGVGALQPGRNSGFLVLEVEGRVVRGGQVVANSRETREFEVLPKCCGASLGSNNSGGTNYAGTTGSLGSDSRQCNLQYGVVTGFNGGWHWSFFANDQFTQRSNETGTIERYGPILGVVDNAGDLFERSNCRVRPGRGKLASGNCPRTNDTSDSDVGDDNSFNSSIVGAGAPDANERVCRQTGPATYFSGPDTDIRGTSVSCSPIVALEATAFPEIDDFVFTWTENWGPDLIIDAA
jgi:type II secretory pathway pseudopilin PulG